MLSASLINTLIMVGGLVTAVYVLKTGNLPPILQDLVGGTATTGEGGTTQGSTVAGDCGKTVYQKTGRVQQMPGKAGTRNYASGAPSEPTWESEYDADSSWKNYEVTAYLTLPNKGDNDVVFKMYGPHHKNGAGKWYVFGVSTKGKPKCGAETKHPGDNPEIPCTGGEKTDVGSLLGKRFGIKCAIWQMAGGDVMVECYIDLTGKWEKLSSMKNPVGKFDPKTPQNILLRIDGMKGVKVDCCTVQEIVAPTGGTTAAAPAPVEKAKSKFAYARPQVVFYNDHYVTYF